MTGRDRRLVLRSIPQVCSGKSRSLIKTSSSQKSALSTMSTDFVAAGRLPRWLEDARVAALPESFYYVADFITQEEERELLSKIASAPKPRWKVLGHRRLQTWPSELIGNTLLDAALPSWLLDPVVTRLLSIPLSEEERSSNIFSHSPHSRPNHVLINEYLPGQGIMPHKDGSAYHPVVCTVSLGSSLCLDIHTKNDDGSTASVPRWKILQEPRSLLITTRNAYTDYLHGISETTTDSNLSRDNVANWSLLRSPELFRDGRNERQARTSLTYRDVVKVSKLGNKLGLMGRKA